MTRTVGWGPSGGMDETHTSTWTEADAIREWIERYEPRLLSPHQRTHLLPRLRELVLAGEFSTLSYARAAMSRAVRFISDMASPEVVDVGEVLSEVNIAAWSHGRPGCRIPSAQDVSSVRRLLAVAQGLRPRRETAARAAETLPVFTADEFGVLGTVTRSDEDTRMLVAVVGAGMWGPEADGAYIDVVDGVPQVRLANGATREVDPALLEALPTVSAGRVQMEGWNNLTRRASRRGVKLTQYRARDAWAARMLSDALPAVQVIRNLGIHRETIAAVAPLLELPAPEETREMLRGQPRGDWRRERDRHGRPQPATSDAGPEVEP